MLKSIYLVNNPYIERLWCHFLIFMQTLIFQPQLTRQILILRLGNLWFEIWLDFLIFIPDIGDVEVLARIILLHATRSIAFTAASLHPA